MANNPYVNKVQLADGTSLIDITDTTATADKILQGYTAYGADGSKLTGTATGGGGSVTQDQDGYIVLPSTGGGGSITVEALSVTQNGTYTAQTGHAYSPVTVSVSGGASNVVTGTFTGTTTDTAIDITLNYSGSGYPIAVMIYPSEGSYKNGGTFYNLIQNLACHYWIATKSDMSTSPTYSADTTDKYSGYQRRKSSESTATTYAGTAFVDGNVANDISALSNNTNGIVRLRSKTKMSVYITSTSYGFAANIEYKYWVLYSS